MTSLRLDIHPDQLARITFDLPGSKANTLGQAVLADWEEVLTHLETRQDLRGLILVSGKPGMFIAGADLRELASLAGATPEAMRKMVQRGLAILARLEKLPYPTMALIDGPCLGGGLELALAFDYRLAGSNPKVEIGFPEVKVGLIPGWGGTQRCPRLIGCSQAVELICGGDSIKLKKARELGFIFDAVPSDRLEEEARRILAWSTQSRDWMETRRRKQQPIGLSEDQFSFTFAVAKAMVLAKTKGQLPAPLAAVESIAQGCNRPLEECLKGETEIFLSVAGSTISRNLIAIFFMSQRLQKDTGVADREVRALNVNTVGVVGAGIMGAGIAGAHIRKDIPALMLDVNQQALDKGKAAILKVMKTRVEIGRMTNEELLDAFGQLSTATMQNLSLLGDRDLIIEAIVENEEEKKRLYGNLQQHLKPHTILASNTSTISITRIAQAVARPENFAGLHFFNPVDRMQLVEVIRGEKTSDQAVVTLVALAKRLGKTPIVVRDCPGFLVNRILFPYINEAMALLEEGAQPRKIDKAATDFGMPMGPFTLSDLVGLDTSLYAGQVINDAFPDRAKNTRILGEFVKAGRLGKKSGAGFYLYDKETSEGKSKGEGEKRGADDPALTSFLDRCRTDQRSIDHEEITDRLFLTMLVEASRVLMEGIVRDPADVDMGLILGVGFPPYRGGILRWADTIGLDKILTKLAKYEPLGNRFQPTDQLRRLAAENKGYFV